MKYLIYFFVFIGLFVSCDKSDPVKSKVMQTDNKILSEYDKIVDYAFKNYVNKNNNAGFSIALIDSENIYKYNYGETILGNGVLPNENTVYEIGSITKVFTSITLISYLKKKGIDINTPIKNYLPYSLNSRLNKNGAEITFKHLLNHTSGLERIPSDIISSKNPYAGYDSTKIFNYLLNNQLVYTQRSSPINYTLN
ncbi:MAG TPA: serine hydrolase domain-containing protein, partial [Melioribacteraceae bacterium]|nr:serine hydrolase domain-containing protein [Melioribacteraceae bacterium]